MSGQLYRPVAQLAERAVSKTGGCGFDSCLACLEKATPSSEEGGVLAVRDKE